MYDVSGSCVRGCVWYGSPLVSGVTYKYYRAAPTSGGLHKYISRLKLKNFVAAATYSYLTAAAEDYQGKHKSCKFQRDAVHVSIELHAAK